MFKHTAVAALTIALLVSPAFAKGKTISETYYTQGHSDNLVEGPGPGVVTHTVTGKRAVVRNFAANGFTGACRGCSFSESGPEPQGPAVGHDPSNN